MEFLKTSWIFRIQSKQYKYNVTLCVLGGKVIKTIRTDCIIDVQKACQQLYPHYDADLSKIPEYSEDPYNLVVTKQCWLRHTQIKHVLNDKWVTCVAFHPSGQYMISGSLDRTVRVWDVKTWNCIQTLTGQFGGVYCVAFHPSGQYMVSGSSDKTLRVWDVETWTLIQTLTGHSNWIRCVLFHPLGQYMVSGSEDNTLRVWE